MLGTTRTAARKPVSLLSAILLLAAAVCAQNTSIYTSTKPARCKKPPSAEEAGSYDRICSGPGGYKLKVYDDDMRQSLGVVTPKLNDLELEFWSYYGSFSWIGEKIEWRLKGATPVALIARFTVSDPEDARKKTSYLMVSKVGPAAACVTDIVAPGPRQNEQARRLADTAFDRACKPFER